MSKRISFVRGGRLSSPEPKPRQRVFELEATPIGQDSLSSALALATNSIYGKFAAAAEPFDQRRVVHFVGRASFRRQGKLVLYNAKDTGGIVVRRLCQYGKRGYVRQFSIAHLGPFETFKPEDVTCKSCLHRLELDGRADKLTALEKMGHAAWTDAGLMSVFVDTLLEQGLIAPESESDPPSLEGALYELECLARNWVLHRYQDLELRVTGKWPDLVFLVYINHADYDRRVSIDGLRPESDATLFDRIEFLPDVLRQPRLLRPSHVEQQQQRQAAPDPAPEASTLRELLP